MSVMWVLNNFCIFVPLFSSLPLSLTHSFPSWLYRENYNNCGGERNSHPELYIQTELKDIRIDRPLLSSQCDLEEGENSTDVVNKQH